MLRSRGWLLVYMLMGAVLVGVGPRSSLAQTQTASPDAPSIRVGVTIFGDYSYTVEPESTDSDGNVYNPSVFNVARTYLNVTGTINRHIAFRITPDISRESGPGTTLAGSQVFRLKYGYAQVNLDDWFSRGSWVRFGVQQTAFVNFEEDVYRYRFQGTVFPDREGYLSSSDAGAAFRYNIPSSYGEVVAGLYNGESYARAETNDQKAFQIRGTVRPFPDRPILRGLRVTGFYYGDHYVKDGERTRAIGSATFEHPYVNAGYHYMAASDQRSVFAPVVDASGFSFWLVPRTRFGLEGLMRFDRLTPDTTLNGERRRTILGVAYWVPTQGGVSTAVLLDYEGVTNEAFTPVKPDQRKVALHVLVNF